MASAKLILLVAIVATLSMTASADLLDSFVPKIITAFYNGASSKEGYRFNIDDPNGSKREEVGMIMNPGTKEQEFVVMGSYTAYDTKTGTETITMYTADNTGYKTRYTIRKRRVAVLKASVGG